MPLALTQAAAVIRGQHLPYGTYLERLRALPVAAYLTRGPGQPYPHGVAEAVLLSMQAVQDGDQPGVCAGLMAVLSVLSAVGVRRDLLYAAGQASVIAGGDPLSEAVVDEALGRLAERSLLTFSLDGQAVIVHRLIMRVIRDGLAQQGQFTAVCRAASSVLDTRADVLRGSEDRRAIREIAEQVTALWENARGPKGEADSELARMLLQLRLASLYYLNELGDSAPQAIAVGEPLAADLKRVLGLDHPVTLASRNNLALAYRDAGRGAEAILLHEQTHAALQQVLGPDHPRTLTARNNLALAYGMAGRVAEAIPLFEQTRADQERVLGPDHPHTLTSRNNLATAYLASGRAAEAVPLHEQTLADRERLLGPDHPDTLTSRNNLANAYRQVGRAG